MQHGEFEHGQGFWMAGACWRVTDIGGRTITAIKLDYDHDPSMYIGPPYKVAESVLDEYDLTACSLEAQPEHEGPSQELMHIMVDRQTRIWPPGVPRPQKNVSVRLPADIIVTIRELAASLGFIEDAWRDRADGSHRKRQHCAHDG